MAVLGRCITCLCSHSLCSRLLWLMVQLTGLWYKWSEWLWGMRNVLYRLRNVSPSWCDCLGGLEGAAFLEEARCWRQAVRVCSFSLLPPRTLRLVLTHAMLLLLPVCLPATADCSIKLYAGTNFPLELAFGHGILSKQQKINGIFGACSWKVAEIRRPTGTRALGTITEQSCQSRERLSCLPAHVLLLTPSLPSIYLQPPSPFNFMPKS